MSVDTWLAFLWPPGSSPFFRLVWDCDYAMSCGQITASVLGWHLRPDAGIMTALAVVAVGLVRLLGTSTHTFLHSSGWVWPIWSISVSSNGASPRCRWLPSIAMRPDVSAKRLMVKGWAVNATNRRASCS